MAAGFKDNAIRSCEMAQELEPENEHVKEMLAKLKENQEMIGGGE